MKEIRTDSPSFQQNFTYIVLEIWREYDQFSGLTQFWMLHDCPYTKVDQARTPTHSCFRGRSGRKERKGEGMEEEGGFGSIERTEEQQKKLIMCCTCFK